MVATQLDSRFRVARTSVLLGLVWLQIALPSGCKKAEEIRVYTVPHRAAPQISLQRMLGAIIPNDKEAWFFKLQGPDEEVAKLEPEFVAFTKSVTIKDKKVEWKAPEAWKQEDGRQFRVTTYLIPNGKEKPFELAISKLDAPDGVNDSYLQANLSRWRGQLSLDPIDAADVAKVTTKVKFDGGEAWMVNFVGEASRSGSMGMPGAAGPMADRTPPATPEEKPPATAQAGGSDFVITPKGWGPGKASAMRKASFAVTEGDMKADISVIVLPATNNLLDNVNRWRGQVGLESVSAAELEKTGKKVEVSGLPGTLVELVGKTETILGAMVIKGDSAYFFKLQAPVALAGKETARFEEFVKSARLP